jgi:hypothetical protein
VEVTVAERIANFLCWILTLLLGVFIGMLYIYAVNPQCHFDTEGVIRTAASILSSLTP